MKCCLSRTQRQRKRAQPSIMGFTRKHHSNISAIFCLLLVIGDLTIPLVVNALIGNLSLEKGVDDHNGTKSIQQQSPLDLDAQEQLTDELVLELTNLSIEVLHCGQEFNNASSVGLSEEKLNKLKSMLNDAKQMHFKIIEKIAINKIVIPDDFQEELLANVTTNIETLDTAISNITSNTAYSAIEQKELKPQIDRFKKYKFWKRLAPTKRRWLLGAIAYLGTAVSVGFASVILDAVDLDDAVEDFFDGDDDKDDDYDEFTDPPSNQNLMKIWILVIIIVVVVVVIYLVIINVCNKRRDGQEFPTEAATTTSNVTDNATVGESADTATPIPDIDLKVNNRKVRKSKSKRQRKTNSRRSDKVKSKKSSRIDMANSRQSSVVASGYQQSNIKAV